MNRRKNSLAAVILAAALLPNAVAGLVQGAVPGRSYSDTDPANDMSVAVHSADGLLSQPVIDHLLKRPDPESDTLIPGIHINYPAIGHRLVDADIHKWVTELADAFAHNFDFTDLTCELESAPSLDSLHSFIEDSPPVYELWGNYSISRPSPMAVSVAFELWNYTGSEEANLDILTLNYSLLTGQRLSLVDIFEKPEVALKLMSDWSRKALESRLGASRRTAMLADGTEPLIENFSSLTLTPEGICINFQPWQVAPSSAGIQRVLMPLEELLPSSPLMALWGK